VKATAPLRAALLNFAYWPEVRRGNERLVHDLATELARRGHDSTIVTSHPAASSETLEDGIRVIRGRRPPDLPLRLRRFQDNLTHLPGSYRALNRLRPDIAHAFFPTDALAAVHWAERNGRSAVFTITGIPGRENVSNMRLRRRILERTTTQSDAVVVISRAARDEAWRWLAVEPEVIYPGVDLCHFTPGERAPVPTIGCASDPGDQRKRVELLVRAFSHVRRQRANAELLLIRPVDESLARELSGLPGIRLQDAGVDTAPRIFQKSWVSALCSYREAFGLVLVESLACGTPVVGADSGAISEVVDRPEVGSLFAEPEEDLVAKKLLAELDKGADAATASACRARAKDFSIARSAEAHESMYRRLASR
jgi:phosphatidylinositol alpha-mannosyltransferase